MTATESSRVTILPRWATDLASVFELGKPRLAFAAAAMAAGGFVLASNGAIDASSSLALIAGTLLVSFGSGAMNMVLEREADARMPRTADRPLPSGRVSVRAATVYSLACVLSGLTVLAMVQPLASGAAAAMFLLYAFVYTPLKQRTVWNTVVGAVPGALPPVIGTLGAAASLEGWGISLVVVTFFWQIPHFLPIGFLYRGDYQIGGMRMLPAEDPDAHRTNRWLTGWTAATLVASALPISLGVLSNWALPVLIVLGANFAIGVRTATKRPNATSMRALFRASLRYLGLLLATYLVFQS